MRTGVKATAKAKPEGRVLHRTSLADPPLAVRGEGCFLFDAAGKRYLDASGGAAVSCLGHGHRAVIDAIQRQAGRLAYAHTSFFSNEPMEALADFLVERAPGDLGKVYFVSGGSEAMEASLKLARQYFLERGEPQREHSLHGPRATTETRSAHSPWAETKPVGGNIAPLLVEVPRISACTSIVSGSRGSPWRLTAQGGRTSSKRS